MVKMVSCILCECPISRNLHKCMCIMSTCVGKHLYTEPLSLYDCNYALCSCGMEGGFENRKCRHCRAKRTWRKRAAFSQENQLPINTLPLSCSLLRKTSKVEI